MVPVDERHGAYPVVSTEPRGSRGVIRSVASVCSAIVAIGCSASVPRRPLVERTPDVETAASGFAFASEHPDTVPTLVLVETGSDEDAVEPVEVAALGFDVDGRLIEVGGASWNRFLSVNGASPRAPFSLRGDWVFPRRGSMSARGHRTRLDYSDGRTSGSVDVEGLDSDVCEDEVICPRAVVLSPDGRFVAARDGRYRLFVFEVPTGARVSSIPVFEEVHSFVWALGGRALVVGDSDSFRLVDVPTGRTRTLFGPEPDGYMDGLEWNAPIERFLTSGPRERVRVWDLETGDVVIDEPLEGDTLRRRRGPVSGLRDGEDGPLHGVVIPELRRVVRVDGRILDVSADGRTLAACERGRWVALELSAERDRRIDLGPCDGIEAGTIRADGSVVAAVRHAALVLVRLSDGAWIEARFFRRNGAIWTAALDDSGRVFIDEPLRHALVVREPSRTGGASRAAAQVEHHAELFAPFFASSP